MTVTDDDGGDQDTGTLTIDVLDDGLVAVFEARQDHEDHGCARAAQRPHVRHENGNDSRLG